MGVKDLWTILSPIMTPRPLTELRGETLAVDLSIWICETQGVKQMQGVVVKPHLRNLFFRVSNLSQLGVKLVFVVEGEPPVLKWEAMMKRQEARGGATHRGRRGRGQGRTAVSSRKPTRSHFKTVIKERQQKHKERSGSSQLNFKQKQCCDMLTYLGVPYVQSEGEAEAMCALLNREGLVDACLTDDGDAFLYGARSIYRNFTMNTKDPHVEVYEMVAIETQLGLNREKLVSLGLLLGCDYVPKGVPGVGKETAMSFLAEVQGDSVLQRFRSWKSNHRPHMPQEVTVWKRALVCEGFPFEKVIAEFMLSRDTVPKHSWKWRRPNLLHFQKFCLTKMEWVEEYSREKILPLLTLWDMTDIQLHGRQASVHLHPHSIVKARVRQGVSCFEVEWQKVVGDTSTEQQFYVTIEKQELFSPCFPELVKQFEETAPATRKTRRAKPSPSDEAENTTGSCKSIPTMPISPAKVEKSEVRVEPVVCSMEDLSLDESVSDSDSDLLPYPTVGKAAHMRDSTILNRDTTQMRCSTIDPLNGKVSESHSRLSTQSMSNYYQKEECLDSNYKRFQTSKNSVTALESSRHDSSHNDSMNSSLENTYQEDESFMLPLSQRLQLKPCHPLLPIGVTSFGNTMLGLPQHKQQCEKNPPHVPNSKPIQASSSASETPTVGSDTVCKSTIKLISPPKEYEHIYRRTVNNNYCDTNPVATRLAKKFSHSPDFDRSELDVTLFDIPNASSTVSHGHLCAGKKETEDLLFKRHDLKADEVIQSSLIKPNAPPMSSLKQEEVSHCADDTCILDLRAKDEDCNSTNQCKNLKWVNSYDSSAVNGLIPDTVIDSCSETVKSESELCGADLPITPRVSASSITPRVTPDLFDLTMATPRFEQTVETPDLVATASVQCVTIGSSVKQPEKVDCHLPETKLIQSSLKREQHRQLLDTPVRKSSTCLLPSVSLNLDVLETCGHAAGCANDNQTRQNHLPSSFTPEEIPFKFDRPASTISETCMHTAHRKLVQGRCTVNPEEPVSTRMSPSVALSAECNHSNLHSVHHASATCTDSFLSHQPNHICVTVENCPDISPESYIGSPIAHINISDAATSTNTPPHVSQWNASQLGNFDINTSFLLNQSSVIDTTSMTPTHSATITFNSVTSSNDKPNLDSERNLSDSIEYVKNSPSYRRTLPQRTVSSWDDNNLCFSHHDTVLIENPKLHSVNVASDLALKSTKIHSSGASSQITNVENKENISTLYKVVSKDDTYCSNTQNFRIGHGIMNQLTTKTTPISDEPTDVATLAKNLPETNSAPMCDVTNLDLSLSNMKIKDADHPQHIQDIDIKDSPESHDLEESMCVGKSLSLAERLRMKLGSSREGEILMKLSQPTSVSSTWKKAELYDSDEEIILLD